MAKGMVKKFKIFILYLFIFSVLLISIHYIHMRFFKVNVVLYSALMDVLIGVIITSFFLFRVKIYDFFEKFLILFLFLLAGYAFAISIPTVIDRSLSFYILEKLDQRGGGIQKERFKDVFINEYLNEHRLIDVRLTEQLESGTIIIEKNCVKLTNKGYIIAKISRFYRKNFLPPKRLLMGEYSDDLVDPFRNSKPNVDYLCK
ncbi:hypothetical protein [Thermodesulfovibrio sp. Kuro-1]|uniref:hypothetical protein n=1 Tax=Thermodesulfovibrio sp. Kuro-1 TaxID=2580394 RepID=UPI001C6410B2|nr:hypothetical protein [Thermodesulfovibrio sp. Kuro-1]